MRMEVKLIDAKQKSRLADTLLRLEADEDGTSLRVEEEYKGVFTNSLFKSRSVRVVRKSSGE